jgi:hypothetical protein
VGLSSLKSIEPCIVIHADREIQKPNLIADNTDQPSPGSHGIADIAVIGKSEIPIQPVF